MSVTPNSEILNLRFTAMAYGGEGLARDGNGRIIFVPYAIAGETARVQIVEARRGFARGRLLELIETAPARVEPRCPHFPPAPNFPTFGFCGGCQWQHIAYEAQLEFKTQIVRDQFTRLAKMPDAPISPIIPSANPWHYRNNMQFGVNEEGKLCLQEPDSHNLVPIRECLIMDDALGEMFKSLELDPESFNGVTLRAGENTGERFIILESDDPMVPELETDERVSIAFRSDDVTAPLLGNEALTERVGAPTFRISPDSFFQVNTGMTQILVDLVTDFLAPRETDVLLDAYSGVGLFGLTLARQVGRVIEIEENPEALDDARSNAHDLQNVEFHRGSVETVVSKLEAGFTLAVVDPPRAGLERAALDAIAVKKPRTIAYVSCDPATLARDAARFVEHGYRLTRVQPVDMFPQTYHIECVAAFRLVD